MQDLSISLIQTSVDWEEPEANRDHFQAKIESITEPTDIIILPEMFTTGFTMDAAKNAEEVDGESMKWMSDMAREKGCVICGSLIIHDNGHYFNRLIWMSPDGSYEKYDKKHLFRLGDEHKHYSAGSERLIVEIKGWKVMPMICYDLRFPVWSKNEYRNGEYAFDLMIYVANWPAARSTAFTSLLAGRAIENMAYVAGSNRIGTDGRGYVFEGKSRIIGPEGNILFDLGANKEAIISLTLKPEPLLKVRARLGVGKDWDKFELL